MPLWQWPTHPNWRMNGLAEVYLVVLETDPIEHEFSSLLPIYPWLVSQGNRIRIIKYLARPVCLGYHDWHWEPWTGQHASVQGRTQLRYENKLDIAKPKCYSIKNSNILAPRVMIVCFFFVRSYLPSDEILCIFLSQVSRSKVPSRRSPELSANWKT